MPSSAQRVAIRNTVDRAVSAGILVATLGAKGVLHYSLSKRFAAASPQEQAAMLERAGVPAWARARFLP